MEGCKKKEIGGLPIDKGVMMAEKRHYEAMGKLRMAGYQISHPTIRGLHEAHLGMEKGEGRHGEGHRGGRG